MRLDPLILVGCYSFGVPTLALPCAAEPSRMKRARQGARGVGLRLTGSAKDVELWGMSERSLI
jgi:hypothetical protein